MAARVLLRERTRMMALAAGPSSTSGTDPFLGRSSGGIDNGNNLDAVMAEAEFMITRLRSLTAFYPGLRAYFVIVFSFI